jgi:hypothetical protein
MKKLILNTTVFFLATISTFLLIELYLSSTHIVDPAYNEMYSDIGRGRRANFEYIMFNEGFTIGKFNKNRYLGPNYPKEKTDSIYRIALIGDSFVEGFQLFDRNHIRSIIEKKLNKHTNKKIEVLNFGRSGFDIGDMYAYERCMINKFQPDLKLYILSESDLQVKYSDPLMVKTKLSGDSLIIDKSYPIGYLKQYKLVKPILQQSSFLNMINNGRKQAKLTGVLPKILGKLYISSGTPKKSAHDNHPELNTNDTPDIVKKIVQQLNPQNTIIINRDLNGLSPGFLAEVNTRGIKFIDVKDTLIKLKKQGIDPFYWKATKKTGHLNHEAHQVIASQIAHEISKIIHH